MTVPAIRVLSFAASRPFKGSSMIRADSTTSARVDVLVSTCTVWPATVTVSVTAPTSMGILMVRLWLASNTHIRLPVRAEARTGCRNGIGGGPQVREHELRRRFR